MKLNRRNALIGLGAIATGGGALFGSGAFSQVEADRTMTVSFSNDSTAELGLNPTSTYASTGTTNDSQNGANTLLIEFNNLNDSAQSTFTGVFDITNNDSTGADHNVQVVSNGDIDGTIIDFQDSTGTSLVDNPQTVTNGSSISVTIVIDSRNTISNNQTVKIRAN